MISQHGVNNTFNRGSTFHSSPFGHVVIPDCEIGDLQIVEVHQHEHLDSACGPTFAVVIQNQSTRSVCGFHVTAVAVFGHICPTSPNATVKTDKIEAGESLEVLVAIDSFDELMESDEANNLKAFDAASIPVVSVSVTTTVETESVSTIQSGSVQNAQPSAVNVIPQSEASQIDSVQNGQNELPHSEPDVDSLRSAIKMLDTNNATSDVAAANGI